jgi:hypothetical protein
MIFPDERGDTERFNPSLHRSHLDPSRIPGYSEIVQANDVAKSDPLVFRNANARTHEDLFHEIGATPQKLDVEFQWLPISGASGGELPASQARIMDRYKNQEGFRLATPEDLSSRGYGFPPLGRTAEDGTIRRGADVALYVRSGDVARMWEAARIAEQREAEGIVAQSGGAPGAWASSLDHESVTLKL